MSVIDALKNSVLEGFDTSIAPSDIVLSLAVAMTASLFILFVYKCTMRQVTFNRSFCLSLLLVCCISAMMVLTITSNLALSLGMVGALSIVRFRTAVKDASDTAFLFWSVAAGITSGAGFYLLTALGCLFIGALCVIAMLLFSHVDQPYLLVVRAESIGVQEKVDSVLKENRVRSKLSSLVDNGSSAELIYEMGSLRDQAKLMAALKEIPQVGTVSLVDCRKG